MEQCPYCGKGIKESDRFCLGCGRQLTVDTVEKSQGGGISDLKQCFGSFPVSKIDCYLCADGQKCANYALNTRQAEILNRFGTLDNMHAALVNMAKILTDMRHALSSIDNNISNMNSNIKRLK